MNCSKHPLRSVFLCLIFGIGLVLFPATTTAQSADKTCDCAGAIALDITANDGRFDHPAPPAGPGTIMEITAPRHDPQYFEKEHHTTWYRFIAPKSGKLSMDLVPMRSKDDYDFLLFELPAELADPCEAIRARRLQPLVTNISRVSASVAGRTGLQANHGRSFVPEGPGDPFSRPVAVKKGREYILVVDNVYEGGSGHSLHFDIRQMIRISGKVKSDDGNAPIPAEVTIENARTGEVLLRQETDPLTGGYDLDLEIDSGKQYNLVVQADSHFFSMRRIEPRKVLHLGRDLQANLRLSKLEIGKAFPLKDINFQPNSSYFVPAAKGELRALYRFLKKNSTVNVALEGHINGASYGVRTAQPIWEQQLSEMRAAAVTDYLTSRKIDGNRTTERGFGASRMLYPHGETEKEMAANRRVEVRMAGYRVTGEGMKFVEGNWEAVRKMAAAQNKYVFVDAYTSWCGPCKFMSQKVFPDEMLGAWFNPQFISWKLDMESEEGKAMKEKWNIEAYPTLLFLDAKGELLIKHVGAEGQLEFLDLGRMAVQKTALETRASNGEEDFDLYWDLINMQIANQNLDRDLLPKLWKLGGQESDMGSKWKYTESPFHIIQRITTGTEDPIFQMVLEEYGDFQGSLNQKVLGDYVKQHLFNDGLARAAKTTDAAAWKEIRTTIKSLPITIRSMNEWLLDADLCWYALTKQESELLAASGRYLTDKKDDWNAWYARGMEMMKLETESSLAVAGKYIKQSMALERNADNTLGQVLILEKLGEYDKALRWLKEAANAGRKEGRKAKIYRGLEARIRGAMAGG